MLVLSVALSACGTHTAPVPVPTPSDIGTLTGQIRSDAGTVAKGTIMPNHLAGTVTVYQGTLRNVSVRGQPDWVKPTPTGRRVESENVPQGGYFTFHLAQGTYVVFGETGPEYGGSWAGPALVRSGETIRMDVAINGP